MLRFLLAVISILFSASVYACDNGDTERRSQVASNFTISANLYDDQVPGQIEIEIVSPFDFEFLVSSLETSCGCAKVTVKENRWQPNSKQQLIATLKKLSPGTNNVRIFVTGKDTEGVSYGIPIQCIIAVKRAYRFEPLTPEFTINYADLKSSPSTEFRLGIYKDNDWRQLAATTDHPFSVSVRAVKDSDLKEGERQAWKFELTYNGKDSVPSTEVSIVIQIISGKKVPQTIDLVVPVKVVLPLRVLPDLRYLSEEDKFCEFFLICNDVSNGWMESLEFITDKGVAIDDVECKSIRHDRCSVRIPTNSFFSLMDSETLLLHIKSKANSQLNGQVKIKKLTGR